MMCPSQNISWVHDVNIANTDGFALDCWVMLVFAVFLPCKIAVFSPAVNRYLEEIL